MWAGYAHALLIKIWISLTQCHPLFRKFHFLDSVLRKQSRTWRRSFTQRCAFSRVIHQARKIGILKKVSEMPSNLWAPRNSFELFTAYVTLMPRNSRPPHVYLVSKLKLYVKTSVTKIKVAAQVLKTAQNNIILSTNPRSANSSVTHSCPGSQDGAAPPMALRPSALTLSLLSMSTPRLRISSSKTFRWTWRRKWTLF